jgi:hypothetical protein
MSKNDLYLYSCFHYQNVISESVGRYVDNFYATVRGRGGHIIFSCLLSFMSKWGKYYLMINGVFNLNLLNFKLYLYTW